MDEKLLKKGIKYVVKIGRNSVAVRLIQKNADGVSYLVKNLKTLKPFFVKSAKSFADFQNEDETKALKAIEDENAPPSTAARPFPLPSSSTRTTRKSATTAGSALP